MNTLPSKGAGVDARARIGGELDDDGTVAAPLQAMPTSVFRAEASLVNRPGDPAEAAMRLASQPAPANTPKPTPTVTAPAPAAPLTPIPPAAKPRPPFPALQSCSALARATIMGLFDRLRTEAVRRENVLTVDDLDDLKDEFVRRAHVLESELGKSVAAHVRERLREHRNDARNLPFDRLIVHQFAHLFVRRTRTDLAHGALSRRVLPGFFVALEKMLGESALDSYQERARDIVIRYEDQLEVDGNWATVYADPHTDSLILDALITIAGHFQEFQKRCGWFRGIINGHLAPGDAIAGEGSEVAGWELSEAGCHELLLELFRSLAKALADERQRNGLAERYGHAALSDGFDLCRRLAGARGSRPAAPAAGRPVSPPSSATGTRGRP